MEGSINSLTSLNIGIFTSASSKLDEKYFRLANKVGELIAKSGHKIIYGGAQIGMMGEVAKGALEANGQVIGVFPANLGSREIAHKNLTELIITEDLHIRKKTIYNLSDFFISLPGGFGTLDETFEVLTWNQLGHIQKPLYFFNIDNFFNHLIKFINQLEQEKFTKVYDHVGIKTLNSFNDIASVLQMELKRKNELQIYKN